MGMEARQVRNATRRMRGGSSTATVRWLAVAALAFALAALLVCVLSGCGNTTPTGIPGEGAAPPVTPVAPSGWTTYSNTTHHYSIQYPANWFNLDNSPTTEDVEIYNFDATQMDNMGAVPPPPYEKYAVDAYVNPNHLAMPDFYKLYEQTDSSSPPASSQSEQSATIAGRASLELVQHPVQWSGGRIDYPSITYFVPNGDQVLIVNELYSLGGQPSAVFAHMIGSLKVGT